MKKHHKFEDVLNECLERLLVKGETIGECLEDYPELASELKPLLQTTMAAKEASAIEPRPEFKARARYQFHSALSELSKKEGFALFNWRSKWATAIISVLLLILISSSTVVVASGSMPDGALYPVKLATEEVWLRLTLSDEAKAGIYARLADRRVWEIIYIASKGRTQEAEQTVGLLSTHLANIPDLVAAEARPEMAVKAPSAMAPQAAPRAGGKAEEDVFVKPTAHPRLQAILARNAASHPAALRAALKEASPEMRLALLRAIRILETGYERALSVVED